VTGTGPNAIVDPSIAIYDDIGAGTPNVPCTDNPKNEDCDGDGMVTFNCLNPGTYLVQIGSVTADAGIFSINITQGQNTAVANDQCTDADDIVIDELCVPLDFSTTNIDACPEDLPAGSFSLPCDFNNLLLPEHLEIYQQWILLLPHIQVPVLLLWVYFKMELIAQI
jgi:hypothetical protein